MIDAVLESIEQSPGERLRWLVLDYFKLPPWAEPGETDILWAAANMVLDMRRRGGKTGAGSNPAFDEAEFLRRKEGGA